MIPIQYSRWLFSSIPVVLAALIIALLYWPGTNGALYYDDYNALNPLSNVESSEDAWAFVTGGTASALGRPVALASYLPHAAGWPENRQSILRVNVLIHVANALLLGLLTWMVLRLREMDRSRAYWVAFGAAILWAVLPLIASTSLIAIQRMTSLAALFGLLGLLGFVSGYWLREKRPHLAFFLQFSTLGIGTAFGILAKESAALIPIFALLIDTLLLNHKPFKNYLQNASRILLFSSLTLILFYLSPLRMDWHLVYEIRGWTSWERLQYQFVLLWEYLRLAVAPLPAGFGPFYDHRSIADVQPIQVIYAVVGWISLLVAFVWVLKRYNNPWPLFALLWFFTGHLLESTVIGLELVFEHRNYLAVFGFSWALAVGAASVTGNLRKLTPILFCIFVLIQAASLFALTSLWGNPRMAAENWAERYPGSSRAAIHAASIETSETNQDVAAFNQRIITFQMRQRAIEILDRTAKSCAQCSDVRMQAILHACLISAESEIKERYEKLDTLLSSNGKVNISVADGFFILQDLVAEGHCPGIEQKDIIKTINSLLLRYDSISPENLGRMLFVAAKAQTEINDWHGALDTLIRAEAIAPTALPILQFQIFVYNHLGDLSSALDAIDRRKKIDRSNSAMDDSVLKDLEHEIFESKHQYH